VQCVRSLRCGRLNALSQRIGGNTRAPPGQAQTPTLMVIQTSSALTMMTAGRPGGRVRSRGRPGRQGRSVRYSAPLACAASMRCWCMPSITRSGCASASLPARLVFCAFVAIVVVVVFQGLRRPVAPLLATQGVTRASPCQRGSFRITPALQGGTSVRGPPTVGCAHQQPRG